MYYFYICNVPYYLFVSLQKVGGPISWKFAAGIGAAGFLSGIGLLTLKQKSLAIEDASKESKVLPEKWIKVGTVKTLTLYPVKSCCGIDVDEAQIAEMGLKGKRECILTFLAIAISVIVYV
jgi:hypothetical protein